jgi:hypothetical protein
LDLAALATSQIFQNLRFSSLAAVATVHPSGLRAEHRTRASCAGTSYILARPGYDQTVMLLSGYPCVESSSLEWGEKSSEVTCEPTFRELVRAPVVEDQKWMCWSADPPPVASREFCHGHQARACN